MLASCLSPQNNRPLWFVLFSPLAQLFCEFCVVDLCFVAAFSLCSHTIQVCCLAVFLSTSIITSSVCFLCGISLAISWRIAYKFLLIAFFHSGSRPLNIFKHEIKKEYVDAILVFFCLFVALFLFVCRFAQIFDSISKVASSVTSAVGSVAKNVAGGIRAAVGGLVPGAAAMANVMGVNLFPNIPLAADVEGVSIIFLSLFCVLFLSCDVLCSVTFFLLFALLQIVSHVVLYG